MASAGRATTASASTVYAFSYIIFNTCHGLARCRREVNATTIESALVQAFVEPLLHDLRDAVLMRPVEQQNPVFVRVKVHFEVARRM